MATASTWAKIQGIKQAVNKQKIKRSEACSIVFNCNVRMLRSMKNGDQNLSVKQNLTVSEIDTELINLIHQTEIV